MTAELRKVKSVTLLQNVIKCWGAGQTRLRSGPEPGPVAPVQNYPVTYPVSLSLVYTGAALGVLGPALSQCRDEAAATGEVETGTNRAVCV